MRAKSRAAALMVGAVLAAACSRPQPPRDPAETALALFDLARGDRDDPDRIGSVVAGAGAGDAPGDLRAALRALSDTTRVRATGTEPLDGERRVAVDVEASLSTGGQARYSVQVEWFEGSGWRVTSLSGPGVGWPERTAGSGEGLTTSAPPR